MTHVAPTRPLHQSFNGPFDDDDGRGGPGGWWIFVEVDVSLTPHDIVRPDLVGWRRERLPRPGPVRPIQVVPDRVCEVLSHSTAARDRVMKRLRRFLDGECAALGVTRDQLRAWRPAVKTRAAAVSSGKVGEKARKTGSDSNV